MPVPFSLALFPIADPAPGRYVWVSFLVGRKGEEKGNQKKTRQGKRKQMMGCWRCAVSMFLRPADDWGKMDARFIASRE